MTVDGGSGLQDAADTVVTRPASRTRVLFAQFHDVSSTESAQAGGTRRPGDAAPAAGRALRATLPQPWRAVRGPRAGRHDRADQVDRPVRARARRRVLDVRHADDHRRDQAALPRRQGLGDPGPAEAPGATDADLGDDRGPHPGTRPLADAAGAGRCARLLGGGDRGGHRVRQRVLHAEPRRDRRQRRRRRRVDAGDDGPRRRGARADRDPGVDQAAVGGPAQPGRNGSCCCGSSGTRPSPR